MGSTNRRPPSPLPDALQFFSYFLLVCFGVALIWAWGMGGIPWEATIVGYIALVAGALGLSLLAAIHLVRLFEQLIAAVKRLLRRWRK